MTSPSNLPIRQWTVKEVSQWMEKSGFSEYANVFYSNGISGDILAEVDHDMLKELNMKSVGQRILLIRLISKLIQKNEPHHPIELTELSSTNHDIMKLESAIRERDFYIHKLASEVSKLSNELSALKHDLKPVWGLLKEYGSYQVKTESRKREKSQIRKIETSAKVPLSSLFSSSQKSPNTAKCFSHQKSPFQLTPSAQQLDKLIDSSSNSNSKEEITSGTIRISLEKAPEAFKLFQVSVTDSCVEILQSALKKFNIIDTWQNYVFCAKYADNEQYLNHNEYPFVFQGTLKEVPIFIIKVIKRINLEQKSPDPITHIAPIQKQGLVVAVYAYKSRRDGECDLIIGQRFSVVKYDNGWCMITPKFAAPISPKPELHYWVPAGCLLELNAKEVEDCFTDDFHRVIGTASKAYDRADYTELGFNKGQKMVIIKRFSKWLIAEIYGQRGWVPASHIIIDYDNQQMS